MSKQLVCMRIQTN